jgi:predicted nucleic acid-binding protein
MGMSRIFWDTNLFIYLLEDYQDLSAKTVALRRRMIERGDQLLTSTMTLGEILVKPWRHGDHAICKRYEENLSRGAILIPFDIKAARIYASVRSGNRELKAPDALQLSCAASVGVDLFTTNDDRLQREQVAGIQFVTSLRRAPL